MQERWLGSETPEAPLGHAWCWGSGSRALACSVRLRVAPSPITAGVACVCPKCAGVGALTSQGVTGVCGGPAPAPGGSSSAWWGPECPGPQFPHLQPAPVVLPGADLGPPRGAPRRTFPLLLLWPLLVPLPSHRGLGHGSGLEPSGNPHS